jgi:hypothetical protein
MGTLSQQFDVVAVYDAEPEKPQKLTDYITVLHMMKEGERDRFFMKDITEALEPSYVAKWQEPLKFLTGENGYGVRMSLVEATHEGVPTYLPVIEDTKLGKLLVVGPQGVGGADKWTELTYVNAELYNRQKAVDQINDFMAASAKHRAEKGELDLGEVHTLVENLVKAALILSRPEELVKPGNVVSGDTTLGKCFALVAGGKGEALAYVSACEKPAAASPAAPKR